MISWLRVTRFVLCAAAPAVLPVLCVAGTATIDFETPDLGDSRYRHIEPFEAGGVVFTATGSLGTIKECFFISEACSYCDLCAPCANQLLMATVPSAWCPGCVNSHHDPPIRADFGPGLGSVHAVSVEFQTLAYSTVFLRLYDTSGELLASAEERLSHAYPCGDPGDGAPTARGVVRASTTEAVAYAVMEGLSGWSDTGFFIAIDNFTFGDCLDTAPPALSLSLAPVSMWPPNHRLIGVHAAVEASDDCDEVPQVTLVSVTSDEPDAGVSPQDLPEDVQGAELGTADFDFALRAERAEEGDGRTYTVCYEARDAGGNTTQACATVDVPHDRRGRASLAGSGSRWQVVLHGSPTMGVREVDVGSVVVSSGSGEGAVALGPPQYGDLDQDGREDVMVEMGEGLPAGLGTEIVYTRWEAGGQTYLAEIEPVGVTGVPLEIPGTLEASVHPNPGLRHATVLYALPRAGWVRLRVYDVAGHQVASLTEGWEAAGRHTAVFAPRARSGIYLYRLEWEGESRSGKFAVLR